MKKKDFMRSLPEKMAGRAGGYGGERLNGEMAKDQDTDIKMMDNAGEAER